MVRELLQFTQILGHVECTYLCDNEPAALQIQKLVVRARKAMGLPTKDKSPAAYSHGNALCENSIARVRNLAGSLMHRVQQKLSVELDTNNGLWSWAFRHAAWLLNRFSVVHGATPFEVVYGKVYKGRLAEFGEPAFSYVHTTHKGNPRWQRVLVLGKTEGQDTYVVFTGKNVMLSRSIRRIATDWKAHLGYYVHFNAPTWCFKTGFGSRIIPTRRTVEPLPASNAAPIGPVMPSPLHDADGEAVRAQAQEEKREEGEQHLMGVEDERSRNAGSTAMPEVATTATSNTVQAPQHVQVEVQNEELDMSFLEDMVPQEDMGDGQQAPVTPPVTSALVPPSPRASPSSRAHDEAPDEHESKKARVEVSKKQRIERVKEEHEKMVRTVKVGEDVYHTLDDYDTDFNWNQQVVEDEEMWKDEDSLQFSGVPEALWSDEPTNKQPGNPEAWVDRLADQVEIDRLLSMGVLMKRDDFSGETTGNLTTRFVYDWRLKAYKTDGTSDDTTVMRWMRRSRFVAREFANTRRDDTYSPATRSHTNHLIPLAYLSMLGKVENSGSSDEKYQVVLCSLDIKDAFLQVPQENVVEVMLHDVKYVVLKNLPGQRLGAKAWYWYFRQYATETMQFEWCLIQPCLARKGMNAFMLHVDDLLFTGNLVFWRDVFLPTMQQKFSISFNVLGCEGSEIAFLKRRLVRLSDGIMVVPGTTVEKVLKCFEGLFGTVRVQKTPCEAGIQQEDQSQQLEPQDSSSYRSIIGLLLYLSRDRLDIMFTVKELSAAMSKPTLCALQRLKRLMGYLKFSGNIGLKLSFPEPGKGKRKEGCEMEWLLETYTDADWSSNKSHRKSTSCALHFLNGCYVHGSSRTQKVISLSSAESELHAMVSGCCDGLFIKRCAEFVFSAQVQHFQWTDNSAARQLAARQGVGRIRHLSSKILWIQQEVLAGNVIVGQVPTILNLSDVGTKVLTKSRLYALMFEVGALDPETLEQVGQEEHATMVEQMHHREAMSKMGKFIKRLALVMGLQGLESMVAEGAMIPDDQVCRSPEVSYNSFWIWLAFGLMLATFAVVTFKGYYMLKKVSNDLQHAWAQVADEDHYIAQQAERIDKLEKRCEALENQFGQQTAILTDQITETSNELSMTHDYMTGLHYSLVEHGGFLRNGLGLSHDQWIHLTTLERANMISSRTMGSVEFMRLVRQRMVPAETADQTDEATEDGTEMEVEPTTTSRLGDREQSLEEMLNFIKAEHQGCIDRQEYWDANNLQNLILELLEGVQNQVPIQFHVWTLQS